MGVWNAHWRRSDKNVPSASGCGTICLIGPPITPVSGETSAGVSSGRKRVGVVFAGVGYRGRRIARGEGVSQGFVHTPLAPARLRVEAHGLAPPSLRLLR